MESAIGRYVYGTVVTATNIFIGQPTPIAMVHNKIKARYRKLRWNGSYQERTVNESHVGQ